MPSELATWDRSSRLHPSAPLSKKNSVKEFFWLYLGICGAIKLFASWCRILGEKGTLFWNTQWAVHKQINTKILPAKDSFNHTNNLWIPSFLPGCLLCNTRETITNFYPLNEDCISNTITKQMENPEIENIMLKKDFGQSKRLDKVSFVTPNYHATSERGKMPIIRKRLDQWPQRLVESSP